MGRSKMGKQTKPNQTKKVRNAQQQQKKNNKNKEEERKASTVNRRGKSYIYMRYN